ncbi:MAG: hypothetical protein WBE41_10170 [Terracidiphilus sp.]
MNFSSILDAVREGWNFVWPPCVLALLLAGLFRFLAPETSKDCKAWLGKLSKRRRALMAFLSLYGLRKFLPAIDGFSVLLILYLLQQLPPAIGYVLPGQFVSDDTALWAQSTGDVVCALAAVPGANLDNLSRDIIVREKAIEAKLGPGAGNELFGADWAQSRLDATIREFDLCKFGILYSLALAGIEIFRKKNFRHSFLSLPLVLAALFICAFFLVARVEDDRVQQSYQLMDDLQVVEQIDGFSCAKVSAEQAEQNYRTLLLARTASRGRKQTELEFVSFYLKWLKEHLTPEQKAATSYKTLLEAESAKSLFTPDWIASAEKKTAASWSALLPGNQKPLDQTIDRLVEMDYFLPSMADQENLDPGSILFSHGETTPLHYFVPSWMVTTSSQVLYPAPTSFQSVLCPVGYHPQVQRFGSSNSISHDAETLLWQVERGSPLIVTERLSCAPDDAAHAQEFVLGYKIAKVE